MSLNKIVARFLDGRTLRGSTRNFDVNAGWFHLSPGNGNGDGGAPATPATPDTPASSGAPGKAFEVQMHDLKAVFFVGAFSPPPGYNERKEFSQDSPQGRRVKITFKDGEVLLGATLSYDPSGVGFFIFPADPQSNNKRVFVVNQSVKDVQQI